MGYAIRVDRQKPSIPIALDRQELSTPLRDSDETRLAPRFDAKLVPWLKSVRVLGDGNAHLVDISNTGALLDSVARLQPGLRTGLTIESANDQSLNAIGKVVRAQLVGLSTNGEPRYRAGLAFEEEIDFRIGSAPDSDDSSESADEPGRQTGSFGSHDGFLCGQFGSHAVVISRATEIGCFANTAASVTVGQWVMVSFRFSETRQLQLAGRVASVVPGAGCWLLFAHQTAEDRRRLRIELREQGRCPGRAHRPLSPGFDETSSLHVVGWIDRSQVNASLRTSEW